MKQLRANKVLGLALGERSLTAAEVVLTAEKPEVRRVGEFVYPAGVTLSDAPALGKALAQFLREKKFGSKTAVVGVPTKWVVAKPKEVPPSDETLAADLLRLQAEGDFSSELKDLVYDYAGHPDPAKAKTVLLMATASRYIQQAGALCESARLDLIAVTVSAATLGSVTGRTVSQNAIVLSLASGGSELTAQTGGSTSVLRHLRGPTPQGPFVNEVRRAVSLLPTNGSAAGREMIVWDGAADDPAGPVDQALHAALGLTVRRLDLGAMGVTTSPGAGNGAGNGTGRRYAAAVALAIAAGQGTLPVDFLHSRLAPPKVGRIPKWAMWAGVGVLALIGATIWGYNDLGRLERKRDKDVAQAKAQEPLVKSAEAFVTKVSFAQGWHAGDARYVACLKEITRIIPDDGQTYATSLNLRDLPKIPAGATPNGKPVPDPRAINGVLSGKTADAKLALQIPDRLNHDLGPDKKPAFTEIKSKGITNAGPGVWSFNVEFVYTPPPVTAAPAPTTGPARAR